MQHPKIKLEPAEILWNLPYLIEEKNYLSLCLCPFESFQVVCEENQLVDVCRQKCAPGFTDDKSSLGEYLMVWRRWDAVYPFCGSGKLLGISPHSFATIPAVMYCFLWCPLNKPSSHFLECLLAVALLHHWDNSIDTTWSSLFVLKGPHGHVPPTKSLSSPVQAWQRLLSRFFNHQYTPLILCSSVKRKLLETWIKSCSVNINTALQDTIFKLPMSVNLLSQCSLEGF